MMKTPYKTILQPVFTEKATDLAENQNKYTFKVHPQANKIEIRQAIETIYKVKVSKVNTMVVRGKARRYKNIPGRTASWKKAVVTLIEGHDIHFG